MKLERWYAADFETLPSGDVYTYGIMNVANREDYTFAAKWEDVGDLPIVRFIEHLRILSRKGSARIYFHNAKFDVDFIISQLVQEWNIPYDTWSSEHKLQWKSSYSDRAFFSLKIWFRKSQSSTIYIFDSFKKRSVSLASLGKLYGLAKLDVPYNRLTSPKVREKLKGYQKRDCEILALTLKDLYDRGLKAMTSATDAYKELKENTHQFRFWWTNKLTAEQYDDCQKAYKGGICYALYKGLYKGAGVVFDYHSAYPAVGEKELLPVGEPHYFKKTPHPHLKLYIGHVQFIATLKKGHVPSILMGAGFYSGASTYLIDSDGVVEMWLTSIDILSLKEDYDLSYYRLIEGYSFYGVKGPIRQHVAKWRKAKNASTNRPDREHAKHMLNDATGKFGQKRIFEERIPVHNDTSKFNGHFMFETRVEEKTVDLPYVPFIAFMTAYQRRKITRVANLVNQEEGEGTVLYIDTDSLHLKRPSEGPLTPPCLIPHVGDKFGQLGIESEFHRYGLYRGQKRYVEDGMIKCCGLPSGSAKLLRLSDFKNGGIIKNAKLISKKLSKGVALVNSDLTFNFKK